jgi:hypothetical protein
LEKYYIRVVILTKNLTKTYGFDAFPQLVGDGDNRLPVLAEAIHRVAPPGEEHPAEHDEPEQVPAVGEEQLRRGQHQANQNHRKWSVQTKSPVS